VHAIEGLSGIPKAIPRHPSAAADVHVDASNAEDGGLSGSQKIGRDEIEVELLDLGLVHLVLRDEGAGIGRVHARVLEFNGGTQGIEDILNGKEESRPQG
jgi:hypothetical protein